MQPDEGLRVHGVELKRFRGPLLDSTLSTQSEPGTFEPVLQVGSVAVPLILIVSGAVVVYLLSNADSLTERIDLFARPRLSRLVYQLERPISEVVSWVSSHRLLALILFTWIVLVLHIPLTPPGERVTVATENFLAVLLTIVVAYASADYLVDYLRYSERRRIADAATIRDAYDNVDLVDVSDVAGWESETTTSTAAATIEHRPDGITRINAIDLDLQDDYYEIDGDLAAILEPERELLAGKFRQEGHYSTPLVRLDAIDGDTFTVEKTSYYRSFLANFCPDLTLDSGKTLRELTKPLLVDEQGLRPLAESPLSNHLGVGCLVVTMDGEIFVAVRSGRVAVDQYSIALPVSGSASSTITDGVDNPSVADFVYAEIEEELALDESSVRRLFYTGTIRRMERLGKPDVLAIAVVDADIEWSNTSGEYMSLQRLNLGTSIALDKPTDVFRPAVVDAIVGSIQVRIADETPPTASILSVLYFLDQTKQ